MRIVRRAVTVIALGLAATVSAGAHAVAFNQLVIFGDSLSDTGNNAIALPPILMEPPGATTAVPVSGNSFTPLLPYSSGRYTNARVWADTFAPAFGVSAAPSLAGGPNFASGGATTGPIDPAFPSTYPPTLLTQVAVFLAGSGGAAPPGALYVVAGGGNNARDTFAEAAFGGGDPAPIIEAGAGAFANDVKTIVETLIGAGATKIVLWNVPDIGTTPAARSFGTAAADLATDVAEAMNAALLATLDAFDLLDDVMLFDVFARVQAVSNSPEAFGLANAEDACAQFNACILGDPAFDPSFLNGHFFWDGIHPTSAGHAILAHAMIAFVPEPGVLALLAIALLASGWVRARTAAYPSTFTPRQKAM